MAIFKGKKIKGKPLVSLIIPAHNEEKYIGKCIRSLLNQKYKPTEIIAVDNSSTDNTWQVIKSFKKEGVRGIKLVGFQKGPGKAWNAGARVSKGKILMLAIGDFEFGPNYVNDMIKPILEGKTVGTMHRMEKIENVDKIWARAHTHEFDELIGFYGSNMNDVNDLGGEIELWLEDEKFILTKSCTVFVPAGMKHCPLIIKRIDRPIFHFTNSPEGKYERELVNK